MAIWKDVRSLNIITSFLKNENAYRKSFITLMEFRFDPFENTLELKGCVWSSKYVYGGDAKNLENLLDAVKNGISIRVGDFLVNGTSIHLGKCPLIDKAILMNDTALKSTFIDALEKMIEANSVPLPSKRPLIRIYKHFDAVNITHYFIRDMQLMCNAYIIHQDKFDYLIQQIMTPGDTAIVISGVAIPGYLKKDILSTLKTTHPDKIPAMPVTTQSTPSPIMPSSTQMPAISVHFSLRATSHTNLYKIIIHDPDPHPIMDNSLSIERFPTVIAALRNPNVVKFDSKSNIVYNTVSQRLFITALPSSELVSVDMEIARENIDSFIGTLEHALKQSAISVQFSIKGGTTSKGAAYEIFIHDPTPRLMFNGSFQIDRLPTMISALRDPGKIKADSKSTIHYDVDTHHLYIDAAPDSGLGNVNDYIAPKDIYTLADVLEAKLKSITKSRVE